ncbi:MAG: hypothetical protein LUF27_05075 [Lachnospiraceae bacterium]|nr:hypothetical protein [Lachnospiraceae bacterium]
MGWDSHLFETWQLNTQLPPRFEQVFSGERKAFYSTKPEDCSAYNSRKTGKMATLYPHVLRALEALVRGESGEGDVAAGVQVGADGRLCYYCMEYTKPGNHKELLVYKPTTGTFLAGLLVGPEKTGRVPMVRQDGNDGEEFIALLSYASLVKNGPAYDREFCSAYDILKKEYQSGAPDAGQMIHAAYLCCDNLRWRIEDLDVSEEGVLPLGRTKAQGLDVEMLSYQALFMGLYAPTETTVGHFTVFEPQGESQGYGIEELRKLYAKEWEFPENVRQRIPRLPDSYRVSASAERILCAIEKTPARVFMMTGSAGVGKTTDAQLIAQVRGVPYYKFTCGPNTDEIELIASMVPNTETHTENVPDVPDYEDLQMDPATALMKVCGEYQDGISEKEAFRIITELLFQKGYQAAKAERDFRMVESPIIEGCKVPSVVEIQEPLLIERPATLAKFNALLDECASIELLNGEVVRRHPDTVIILTTNMDYIGCRQMNESVLSRIRFVDHRPDLTEKEMVQRAMRKTGMADCEILQKMAQAVVKIRRYLKEEELRGGVCEYREYEDWVWAYLSGGNLLKAAEHTVIAKASMDAEERQEMMTLFIRPVFEEL